MADCYTVCVDVGDDEVSVVSSAPYYIRALVGGVYSELGYFSDIRAAFDAAKQSYASAEYLLPIQFEDRYREAHDG